MANTAGTIWTSSRCSLFGLWHYRLGLNTLPQNRLEKRSDLSGVVFRTAANNDPPFVKTVKLKELFFSSPMAGHLQDTRIGLENIHLGPSLYGDLWESLQKLMNFNYTMVRVFRSKIPSIHFLLVQVYSIDGSWGSLNADGSWNGVVSSFSLKKC